MNWKYEKEVSHDFVMLSDSWTAKLDSANSYYCDIFSFCKTKREKQMMNRMDRNFGDLI